MKRQRSPDGMSFRDGAAWAQVGEVLGISRQAAHERFRTGPAWMHSRW